MILRIVKMTFNTKDIAAFEQMFDERKQHIRDYDGCLHLELWQDAKQPNVFFTYSHWASEAHLDHYRFSKFFKETWAITKSMFADKAEAWSVIQKDKTF